MRSPHHHTVRPGMAVRRSLRAPRHVRTRARGFGHGREWSAEPIVSEKRGWGVSDELQLFGMTFAAGFVFVSVLIG